MTPSSRILRLCGSSSCFWFSGFDPHLLHLSCLLTGSQFPQVSGVTYEQSFTGASVTGLCIRSFIKLKYNWTPADHVLCNQLAVDLRDHCNVVLYVLNHVKIFLIWWFIYKNWALKPHSFLIFFSFGCQIFTFWTKLTVSSASTLYAKLTLWHHGLI